MCPHSLLPSLALSRSWHFSYSLPFTDSRSGQMVHPMAPNYKISSIPSRLRTAVIFVRTLVHLILVFRVQAFPKASRLPRKILLIHGALTIVLPYVHTRLRGHALSKAWPDAPSSDHRRKAWEFMTRLETTHAAVALASFIAFLWDGR